MSSNNIDKHTPWLFQVFCTINIMVAVITESVEDDVYAKHKTVWYDTHNHLKHNFCCADGRGVRALCPILATSNRDCYLLYRFFSTDYVTTYNMFSVHYNSFHFYHCFTSYISFSWLQPLKWTTPPNSPWWLNSLNLFFKLKKKKHVSTLC